MSNSIMMQVLFTLCSSLNNFPLYCNNSQSYNFTDIYKLNKYNHSSCAIIFSIIVTVTTKFAEKADNIMNLQPQL